MNWISEMEPTQVEWSNANGPDSQIKINFPSPGKGTCLDGHEKKKNEITNTAQVESNIQYGPVMANLERMYLFQCYKIIRFRKKKLVFSSSDKCLIKYVLYCPVHCCRVRIRM